MQAWRNAHFNSRYPLFPTRENLYASPINVDAKWVVRQPAYNVGILVATPEKTLKFFLTQENDRAM
jgi:hypothetical protein